MGRRGKPIPAKVRAEVVARSHGLCEIRLVQYGCVTFGSDMSHRKSRARGGSNEAGNLDHACRPCHRAVEEHRPGTERWRTFSWQKEGERESDAPDWKAANG